MTECNYYLVNPTNNVTILVESQFSAEVQPFVAKKLLEKEKRAEQVGFITNEVGDSYDIKVRMSGGEFCGNACMAAAAVFLDRNNSKKENIGVSISGCEKTVNVTIDSFENGCYMCSVDMPDCDSVSEIKAVINSQNKTLPIVHYKGISHILIKDKLSKSDAENLIRKLSDSVKSDALGLMFVNDTFTELTPLVYVRETDTLYWENSCASGTAALGEYLLKFHKSALPLSVSEPGGKLKIIEKNGITLCGSCIIEKYAVNTTEV